MSVILNCNRLTDFVGNMHLNTEEGSAIRNVWHSFSLSSSSIIAESFNRFVTVVFKHQTKVLLLSEGYQKSQNQTLIEKLKSLQNNIEKNVFLDFPFVRNFHT